MGIVQCKGKLTKDDIEFLAQNTKFTKEQIEVWHKTFKGHSPNGKMTYRQLAEVYNTFRPGGNADYYANYTFKVCDVHNHGYIDFKDFLLMMNIATNEPNEEKLRWTFKIYDINNDNKISLMEMTHLLTSIYRLLDVDHVEYAKFPPHERAKSLFSAMDVNQDGFLSEEEFVNGCLNDPYITELLVMTFQRMNNPTIAFQKS